MLKKRTVYIILTMFLGLLFSFLFLTVLQLSYFTSLSHNISSGACESCLQESFLIDSPIFAAVLAIGGIAGGYHLGKLWWQIVYVEKRHWRFRKK